MRFFFISIVLLIASCKENEIQLKSSRSDLKFLFQNAVALNLSPAGCSILDLGGAGRMCARVTNENPDLVFQVGPAFSPLVPRVELSTEKIIELRKALVQIWNHAGVRFYSVDGLDLVPSLKSFQDSVEKRGFSLLSTNLRTKFGKSPFQSFQIVSWGDQEFIFLGFTSPLQPPEPSGWESIPFQQSLSELTGLFKEHPKAHLLILGSLPASERQEILNLLKRPAYFIGGSLEEENSTEWLSLGPNYFWGKAVDLGRGMGMIQWDSVPTASFRSQFSSKGLRKELDAENQCTKIVDKALSPSR